MKKALVLSLLVGTVVGAQQAYAAADSKAASKAAYDDEPDDDDFGSRSTNNYKDPEARAHAASTYTAPQASAAAIYNPAAANQVQAAQNYNPAAANQVQAAQNYNPGAAQAANAGYQASAQDLPRIHPACIVGGPTQQVAAAGYAGRDLGGKIAFRNLQDYINNAAASAIEDDLEEPFDDPGCGHGVCVLAPGGHGECICDAAFLTTPESGPCGQHQKSQGVAFILQLFLGPFGAGAFYLGGGWVATGVVCLLLGAFSWITLPLLCLVKGIFKPIFKGDCFKDLIPDCCQNGNAFPCFVGFMHCALVITWFVSLIVIGTDCDVHGIPCVPM